MLKLVLGLLALGVATAASAESWHHSGTAGQRPDRLAYWVDTDSIQREGASQRFWVQQVFESTTRLGYDRSMVLYRANCTAGTTEVIEMVDYFPNGTNHSTPGGGESRFPVPGSMLMGVFELVCGRREMGLLAADPVATSRALWRGN